MTDKDEDDKRSRCSCSTTGAGYRRGEHAGLANAMRWRTSSPISRGKAQAWRDSPMCAPR